MRAEKHPRENDRIAALRNYDILDTPKESDFDDIVDLASRLCETPISVINLIDSDRQWFKAEVGLGVRETPLDTSLCSHAILEKDFMEIPDTLQDQRMRDNGLVAGDPGLRFYAGALLQTPDGLPIGTLCVLDYQPRVLTALQRHALRVLAKQVMTQLELRRALKRKELMRKEMDHRVKNSLASVAGMVRLQINRASDPALRAALDSVQQRLRSISLLHEELYRTAGDDQADLGRYLKTLQTMLQEGAPDGVDIAVHAPHVVVTPQTASAVGVIVSEFVMNSFKHAFPDERAGKVTITIRESGSQMELVCRDDGAGAGEIAPQKRGLGLRLISAYASQLGGAADFRDAEPGFELRVNFRRD
ncbi:MAG: histidine kinase dimerization/phosphoacceptor domain -containing protein [Hyphomonadaceae bacterium]